MTVRTSRYHPMILLQTACHTPVPENGNGEIKTKREYVRNGPFRSSPNQLPFNTRSPLFFFKWAPVVRIELGTFFEAYRMHLTIWTCIIYNVPSHFAVSVSLVDLWLSAQFFWPHAGQPVQ